MYRAFLSWRYLRARRTNWIGIVGICVGTGALILILSIMAGFLEENRKAVRGSLSDLVIEPLLAPRTDGRTIPYDPGPTLAIVRADPRVAASCVQLTWFGILSQEGRSALLSDLRLSDPQNADLAGVRLVGIDVEDELATTELRAALERRTLIGSPVADPARPFDPPPDYEPRGRPLASVVVGEQLADAWHLVRGSEINLMTMTGDPRTGEYQPSNRRYVVAGTFRSTENEMDLERIYLDRAELADLLGPPRTFSQVLVRLKDYPRDGKATRDEIADALFAAGLVREPRSPVHGSSEVRTWEEFRGTLLGAIENERVLMAIMLSLVLMVAGFTVFAILSMMVSEKRRDIGILSALGATPGGVASLFLMIGFWDWLLGAAAGAILGTWGALKIDAIEKSLSRALHVQIFNRKVYLFDHIPAVVDPLAIALIVLGALLCTLVFASIPAWKAGRLHPLDALRYE